MLVGDELGDLLATSAQNWNDKDISDVPAARTAFWRAQAKVIIDYFKAKAELKVNVTTTGTATAQTGTGTGIIEK